MDAFYRLIIGLFKSSTWQQNNNKLIFYAHEAILDKFLTLRALGKKYLMLMICSGQMIRLHNPSDVPYNQK